MVDGIKSFISNTKMERNCFMPARFTEACKRKSVLKRHFMMALNAGMGRNPGIFTLPLV